MSRPATQESAPFPFDDGRAIERSEVRSAVTRFLLIGLVSLVAISVPVALWIRGQAEQHTLTAATEHTHQLADHTVAPLVTDGLRAGDPSALRALDDKLAPWLDGDYIVRVKVWDPNGRIIYSDLPSLIGRSFPLPRWSSDLLAGGPERASFGTQRRVDNEQDYALGELVEINVRTTDAAGRPLMFEAYFDDEAVQKEQTTLIAEIIPAFALSLLALQLGQLLPAIGLARRIQAHQAARRRLLQHAIVASDFERRRIARELHDEVIQDLAGLSYAFEAEERHGLAGERPLFGRARAILQRNLGALRAMTTELYPPDLDALGLAEALLRLADPLAGKGIEAHVALPERIELDRDRTALLYRVAREALANTVKHAGAGRVELTLAQDGDRTTLTVRDDGCGFDPEKGSPHGHLGLRIMRDTVRVAGGDLAITSRAGEGTTVVATLDRD
ncbi:signal transduction histidine kinase [Cryobacterium sp. MP_M5]|uniref:sensor histidine kinase n=1 Tax=unclassified Cryobacterium TaxID=2649013 RepID=UPI0018CB895A|nr:MULTISPECIES: sensor histidine kinase [unclassified Cryobacterium]MBG6059384.1 signal transduction histidine kinase [Cryobacterium sp. MP_M3]MEC5177637.1 signal transduction histidine kinase [Cryobacterium sp. MP_M5]